mmetsp:Transcript_19690/g.30829  ORF Transcript_19690/g.30829 Transcript_19690/m.30829 type:complete len:120 (-) Transcript_19690:57-416(-)
MLRSLTSSGPLRRGGFTILGGYASCALYFNIVDERFEETKKSKGEKEKLEMRNVLQSCLRTSPTVGAIILTSLVVSHGVLSTAGASLAILIYRQKELREMRGQLRNLKDAWFREIPKLK